MRTYKDFQNDVLKTEKEVVIKTGLTDSITVIKMYLKQSKDNELYFAAENIVGTGIQNLTKEEFEALEQQVEIGSLKVYDVSMFKGDKFGKLDDFQNKALEEVNVKDKRF
ncbi:Uncharacterised protein [[Clostridium] sordellii]|uniref:hypothetical protein n=1 Tax=Paraclostridium sordellii TaxID=1505 RepID=UPI0005DAB077|nr:hypothetical protein [Paeniclostridium sordellii]CEN84154.1 Uncharacterised protein [[Clostridium] sordellii] [Paeniclostridium sordellii]CEO09672.1 Uncharacterised protein [[Clostridium] sordellii] [Paeniclostridium sordellii]CEP88635.1 Uncharacterised protein [[Clostridium] sordellii] [Paeniclostridium sordellii]